MTEPRICAWHECDNPIPHRPGEKEPSYLRRETCGKSCGSKLGQWRSKQARDSRDPNVWPSGRPKGDDGTPWPRVNGTWPARWERTRPFARFDIPESRGVPFRMLPPDSRSLTGSTAAMLVRGGAE